MNKNVATTLCVVIAVTFALSSCASETEVPGDFVDISLAESKSPTQLLRNSTAERITPEVVDKIVTSDDLSVACLGADTDPKATVRAWQSSVQISLTGDGGDRLDELVTTLVASYEEQGWSASALGGTGRGGSKLLFSETAPQSIQVVGLQPNEVRPDAFSGDAISSASILIVVSGPCVRTDGVDSDEVKQLEI